MQSREPRSMCTVCNEQKAKYCCPSCHERTCSLPCVQQHKAMKNCTGKRSRSSFTSMKEFSDQTLISDLHFLEDVKRVKEKNWRNLRRVALVFQPQEILPHQRKLRYEARQRDMNLRFLARGMSRNKSNSSWYDFRREEICWDIDWILSHQQIHSRRVKRKRVPETEIISDVLSQMLPDHWKEMKVLMKKENAPSNENIYFDFDLDATFKSQLQGKEIVEYPILIVLKAEKCSTNYKLLKNTNNSTINDLNNPLT